MSGSRKTSSEKTITDNKTTAAVVGDKFKAGTTSQLQQQHPVNDSRTSQASQISTMSSSSSSRSAASSTRKGSSLDLSKRPEGSDRKSPVERALEKAKSKLGRRPNDSEALPGNELEFERQRAKAVEKQKRKEEYERLGLKDQTSFGLPGSGSFNSY